MVANMYVQHQYLFHTLSALASLWNTCPSNCIRL